MLTILCPNCTGKKKVFKLARNRDTYYCPHCNKVYRAKIALQEISSETIQTAPSIVYQIVVKSTEFRVDDERRSWNVYRAKPDQKEIDMFVHQCCELSFSPLDKEKISVSIEELTIKGERYERARNKEEE